eukprot:1181713-Prorocentrum_minimum.AAC.3
MTDQPDAVEAVRNVRARAVSSHGRRLPGVALITRSSDGSPSRVYPLVPPPIGPRPGYILLFLLRLVPCQSVSCRVPLPGWS